MILNKILISLAVIIWGVSIFKLFAICTLACTPYTKHIHPSFSFSMQTHEGHAVGPFYESCRNVIYRLVKDADELVTRVVLQAFKTISQIIKNDCAIAIDVKYELEAIDVERSDLRRDIDKYKQRLKQRYTKSLRSDVIEERLKPSYIELRTIISGGLAKLMNIRAKIPPAEDVTPLISIYNDLKTAAAKFRAAAQTWTGWVSSYIVTPARHYTEYCKHLENYLQTTAVNAKVDRVVSKMHQRYDERMAILDDAQARQKFADFLHQQTNKIRNDALRALAEVPMNLCGGLAATNTNLYNAHELTEFIVFEYQLHYKTKLDIIYNRFLRNANIVSYCFVYSAIAGGMAVRICERKCTQN